MKSRILLLVVSLAAACGTVPRLQVELTPLRDQDAAAERLDVAQCEAFSRNYMEAAAAGVEARRDQALANGIVGAVAGAVGGYAGYGAKVGAANWGTTAALLGPIEPTGAPSTLGYWNKFHLMRDL